MGLRIRSVVLILAIVNAVAFSLATILPKANLGTLATAREASAIRGAQCIKPETANPGSNVSVCCGWHWGFGYPGTDHGPSYQESPLFEADSNPCSCSGSYIVFSEDYCFGG
jgi:hypothetical protein